MQVAMRLSPYWWEKLGKKKVYNSTARQCLLLGISLFGTAAVTWLGLISLVGVERYRSSTSNVKSIYDLIFIFTVIFGLLGIAYLTGTGVVFVRTLVASLRFRTIFGFSPPTTDEGHETTQLIVDRILSFRAIARAKEYSRGEELLEIIRANRLKIAKWGTAEGLLEDPIRGVGTLVAQLEHKLGELEKPKKTAEKNYYEARDAARSHYLPLPFVVRKSFKDYLSKKVA
jgi:hypothetical protein